MLIEYSDTPMPTANIQVDNDTIKMGFINETKKAFMQVCTSYSQNGTNIGQAFHVFDKVGLKGYIDMLLTMYEQMEK